MTHDRPSPADPRSPLDGILVADFGRVLAAPYATMLLADLGADVIKIEHPDGDDTRAWGPPYAHDEATYFLSVNRNKRSFQADLRQPATLGHVTELVRRADVLVENFRPGTMDKYGLGPAEARRLNPGLVYCSVTGFGAGKGAALPGYDLLLQAVGGLMSVTGPGPGQPVKAGVALVDVLTGLHATVGVLAALRHRDATGEGQHVEVNLLTTLLSSMVNQSAGYTLAGAVPGILGNRHPSVAPYELFAAADRPIVVAVGNDRQFAALCRALDVPHLATDPRFSTNSGRVAHCGRLAALLGERLRQRTAAEWFELLTPLGVPCGPVNDLADAFALAERLGLDPLVRLDGPGEEPMDLVANPIGLSRTPPRYRRRPPRLGEHTDDLTAWLEGPP
ncbi:MULTISPECIES: CaiB/BaiF CoA transferase family protein [Streptomycetaceae]|uniref:Transferase n=1 Tax=Streptantibioticus cattleyicolor (strain ATCC 35852 / DSM 46488 / JCM 4925 / NBRC 14057 / NRRL 8057) TaxID=1003195 RepID=F8K0K1_STREN|nr:CoA transferase [Streptantibioticus cattleyicolor]AEW97406.1 transferase [Streptantibioticus cattleyicolor NRRL 8057 = DSM 46488]MYS61850.1 CoA transferase [Streptomyces sp. SID5468]CCB77729.1 putative transferase [Streptantibioticus cattleyicolor NRRL 8057 = DSM 46488]